MRAPQWKSSGGESGTTMMAGQQWQCGNMQQRHLRDVFVATVAVSFSA